MDGNGTVADGRLSSAALFVAECRPPDRDAIRQVNESLSRLLTAHWRPPEVDVSHDAPRSTWRAGDLSVSLDCFWSNGEIGLIMVSIEPIGENDARRP